MALTVLAAGLVAALGAHPLVDAEVGPVEVAWQCDDERSGRCHINLDADGPHALVVWFRADAALTLQSAGSRLHTFAGQEPGSAWARVEFPEGEGRLSLHAPSGRTLWALDVEPLPREPEALIAVRKAFDSGAFARADAALVRALRDWQGPADAGNVALALDLRQRIAFREGRFAHGGRLAEQAITAYTALGWTSRGCGLALTLAARHINAKHDAEAADALLKRAAPCSYADPGLTAEVLYLRARVAELRGEWRDADAGYRLARRLAERLQRRRDALGYLSSHYVLADALHDDVALATIDAEIEALRHDEPRDLCAYATVWTNVGWIRLMRRQRGADAPDPRPMFVAAQAAFEGLTVCRDRRLADNNRINLALAELQSGRHREALASLASVELADLDVEEAQWFHIAMIEALLAAGDPDGATTSVAALQALAARGSPPEAAMHAAYHRGLLHAARGQPDQALAAYAAADRARDQLLLPLRFGSARERGAADWDLTVARSLTLLLDAGRSSEAVCVARSARRRSLHAAEQVVRSPPMASAALRRRFDELRQASGVERAKDRRRSESSLRQQHAWRRVLDQQARSLLDELSSGAERPACDDLRSPAAGELQVFYYPIGDDLVILADDGRQVRTRRVLLPRVSDPELLAGVLLGPLDDLLERAVRLRVYAAGRAAELDVHALPWRGRPLLASVPVVYAVDVARSVATSPILAPDAAATLVVADPDRGLRWAGVEADHVPDAWRRLGLAPRRLDGDTGRQEVLGHLADSLVFHFIGHGEPAAHRDPSPDPWDTELQLGDRSSVSVEDILVTLPAAPPLVVLSACETGLLDPRALGGLSLATALVLRGSAVVIASTRRVDDDASAKLLHEFYRQAATPGDLLDPALLSRAQAALLDGAGCEAHPDVCAFRVFVP